MSPAQTNHDVAKHTIDHLLRNVPKTFGLHKFMEQVVLSMLQERVRKAMLYAPFFLAPSLNLTASPLLFA